MDVSKPSAALVQAALLLAVCCGVSTAVAARPSAQKKAQVAPPAAGSVQNAPQPAPTPQEQQVISAAENAYASGMRNYHAGNLTAAKHDFDNAVDTMLSSGLDL